ncbi:MAG: cytochrome c [Proteobacteria bacterium]|nr:cytochrome c [Pseudomonadota bacterium]
MKNFKKTGVMVLLTALVFGVLAGAVAYAAEDAKDVVKYRRAVMSAQFGHFKAIKAIVRGKVGFTGQLANQAMALELTGRGLTDLFPAGTGADKMKTRAKPEIWQDWKKFEASAKKLNAETAKLVKIANGGDKKAAAAQFKAVGKACGGCHKLFRASKKKKK